MKEKTKNKYKIELTEGAIYLDREEMGIVLIERLLNGWIDGKNYEDLGLDLTPAWEGYLESTDEELIEEIQESFRNPYQIKKLICIHKLKEVWKIER